MIRLTTCTAIGGLILLVGFSLGGFPLVVMSAIAIFVVGGLGFPDVSSLEKRRTKCKPTTRREG